MAPLITIFGQDFHVIPNKKNITSIALNGYSNNFNTVDAGYSYKLIATKNSLVISTGLTGGIFYPRKPFAEMTKDDLLPFVAPTVELSYGTTYIFYVAFWKNFMKDDEAPFKTSIGYRHLIFNKSMSVKAYGSFLWIRDLTQSESQIGFTHGGIGVGLERNF